jgi:hypothetical protein
MTTGNDDGQGAHATGNERREAAPRTWADLTEP